MAWHGADYDGHLDPTATDDRQIASAICGDVGGVFYRSGYTDCLCSAGSGFNTNIANGRATVLNTFATGLPGVWVVRNDASASVTHNSNSSGSPRWDAVGVRVFDAETGGDASDATASLVVTGNPSGSASVGVNTTRWVAGTANLTGAPGFTGGPALPNNFTIFAYVFVPNAAGSSASFTYLDWRLFITGGLQDSGWQQLTPNSPWWTGLAYFKVLGPLCYVDMSSMLYTHQSIGNPNSICTGFPSGRTVKSHIGVENSTTAITFMPINITGGNMNLDNPSGFTAPTITSATVTGSLLTYSLV